MRRKPTALVPAARKLRERSLREPPLSDFIIRMVPVQRRNRSSELEATWWGSPASWPSGAVTCVETCGAARYAETLTQVTACRRRFERIWALATPHRGPEEGKRNAHATGDRQPWRSGHAAHPRCARAERPRGHSHRDDRPAYRRRADRDVRPRGRPCLQPRPRVRPPLPQPRCPGAGADRHPRRLGLGGLGLRRRGRRVRRPGDQLDIPSSGRRRVCAGSATDQGQAPR
jgi:hypothetical protein